MITLVIIGVIAAMTIPTLINKTNKQEYVSRLKKTYSTLAQATNRIIAEEGLPRADMGGWATSAEAVYNKYKKHLNKAKECGLTTGCFQGPYRHYNNTTIDLDTNRYTLVLADGSEMSFAQSDFSDECALKNVGSENVCQMILIDVNGAKGPNHVTKDAFAFALKADGLFPTGCDYWGGSASGWGYTCKVFKEGAINY